MRLRWFQPPSSQHRYCYLGRRGTHTQKGQFAHNLEMAKPEFSLGSLAPSSSHQLLLSQNLDVFLSRPATHRPFFSCLSPDKHPLHLTDDSQKGSGFKWGFFPGDKLKASICLHTQGSPARRWAAQDHTWPCAASCQAGRCPRGLTAPASNRTSIMERRVP